MDEKRGPPIGIDFGTSYIRVAVIHGHNCIMIPDEHDNSAMPSYVAFTNSGLLVGVAARMQAANNPANTIFDVIRLIGRRYSHPSVQNGMRLWPFKVIGGPDEMLQVEVKWNGRLWKFNPVEICSMLLMRIKENAIKVLGTTVTDAVITVPVDFNYAQRLAIKQSGKIAGLDIMQIISAPAACAYLYGLQRLSKTKSFHDIITCSLLKSDIEEHNMVIFDLGAGTLDVAVVTINEDVCRVRATAGDVHLGGCDFDNNLIDYFVSLLKKNKGEDLSNIPMAISKLRILCESAKVSLSSGSTMAPLKITLDLYNHIDFESSITETEFNEINNNLFTRCIQIMDTCLRDSGIRVDAVDEVILAGSSTRIPLVKKHIQNYFNSKVLTIDQHLEVATAYGAAFRAFFLRRRDKRWSLLDAAPFSLGLRSLKGNMHVFVPKNNNIPARIKKSFLRNTISYPIEFYEGEGTLVNENIFLGRCELSKSHSSSNLGSINVSLEVHENCNLTVTVEEIPRGKRTIFTFTENEIEDCQNRAWEAYYKESGKNVNNASTTKSLTINDTSCNSDKARDTKPLTKLMNMEKDQSSKILGQSNRQPKEYAIGIDFGTTYSCVAVWRRDSVEIIENEYGSQFTSSIVAFTDTGRLIGDAVHNEQFTSPTNTISNIKRLIGRLCSDRSVLTDNKFRPFKVLSGDKNQPMVSVQYKNEEKLFAPEEIAAMILLKMRETAEAHLNSTVTKAVIGVPAYFTDSQRKAINDAGVIAGLNVMQLLNEPSAIALAYFLQRNIGKSSIEKTLLIFDLGGGNLDVSIVTIKEGNIRVQAVAGDTNLGGEDFDNNMVSHFVEKFMKEKRKDIHNKPRSLRRLRAACEKAKRVLSTNAQTIVEVDALDGGVDFRSCMTRKTFEEINAVLFDRCISCVERCLEDAKRDKSCIDEVVLVGGSTRIPKILQLLQEFFNTKEICRSVNTDEAVVYGAAVQAAILSGHKDREEFNRLELQDVTSLSLGMGNEVGAMMNLLIRKHTPIPATKELIFTNYTDGLSSFSIQVQECELGSTLVYSLSGITPTPRGQSELIVTFEVDDSGILNLKAKDMTTGKKNEIEINKENRGLTKKEIQTMVEMAARYKAEDEEHKKRTVALHSLENFAYEMKAIAKDAGVSTARKKFVEEAADNAITWLETNYNAAIDETSARRKELETIKSQIVYLGADAS